MQKDDEIENIITKYHPEEKSNISKNKEIEDIISKYHPQKELPEAPEVRLPGGTMPTRGEPLPADFIQEKAIPWLKEKATDVMVPVAGMVPTAMKVAGPYGYAAAAVLSGGAEAYRQMLKDEPLNKTAIAGEAILAGLPLGHEAYGIGKGLLKGVAESPIGRDVAEHLVKPGISKLKSYLPQNKISEYQSVVDPSTAIKVLKEYRDKFKKQQPTSIPVDTTGAQIEADRIAREHPGTVSSVGSTEELLKQKFPDLMEKQIEQESALTKGQQKFQLKTPITNEEIGSNLTKKVEGIRKESGEKIGAFKIDGGLLYNTKVNHDDRMSVLLQEKKVNDTALLDRDRLHIQNEYLEKLKNATNFKKIEDVNSLIGKEIKEIGRTGQGEAKKGVLIDIKNYLNSLTSDKLVYKGKPHADYKKYATARDFEYNLDLLKPVGTQQINAFDTITGSDKNFKYFKDELDTLGLGNEVKTIRDKYTHDIASASNLDKEIQSRKKDLQYTTIIPEKIRKELEDIGTTQRIAGSTKVPGVGKFETETSTLSKSLRLRHIPIAVIDKFLNLYRAHKYNEAKELLISATRGTPLAKELPIFENIPGALKKTRDLVESYRILSKMVPEKEKD